MPSVGTAFHRSLRFAKMGGHVAKKLGDGLMALFGYLFATIVAVGKTRYNAL